MTFSRRGGEGRGRRRKEERNKEKAPVGAIGMKVRMPQRPKLPRRTVRTGEWRAFSLSMPIPVWLLPT